MKVVATDKGNKKWTSAAAHRTDLPLIHDFVAEPLEAGLWCLCVSKKDFGVDFLTYDEMEQILSNYLDLPITAIQLKRAFARAGKKIIKNSNGDGYKISSNPGEIYLRGLKKDEPLNVVYVNPDKPLTAKKNLESLVKSMPKGILLICDPYYGLKTLDVLEVFAKYHKEVRFLTSKIGGGEKALTLSHAISDFKKEQKKRVEMRLTSGKDLHDRYVIAGDRFLIIGHGIKDLGNKESLIVVVGDQYGRDIRKTLEYNFNQRWGSATTL